MDSDFPSSFRGYMPSDGSFVIVWAIFRTYVSIHGEKKEKYYSFAKKKLRGYYASQSFQSKTLGKKKSIHRIIFYPDPFLVRFLIVLAIVVEINPLSKTCPHGVCLTFAFHYDRKHDL